MTDRPDNAGSPPDGEPAGSDTGRDSGGAAGGGAGSDSGSDSGARRWVVPALLFVAGLLLGGVAVAAADRGGEDDVPLTAPSFSPSPSPSPSPDPEASGQQDVNVRIPAACVEVAEEADAAFEDVDAFAEAVRDFDARQLQDFLDRFQEVRPRIESLAEECRSKASEGLVEGDLITPTPAVTPTDTPTGTSTESPTGTPTGTPTGSPTAAS